MSNEWKGLTAQQFDAKVHLTIKEILLEKDIRRATWGELKGILKSELERRGGYLSERALEDTLFWLGWSDQMRETWKYMEGTIFYFNIKPLAQPEQGEK